MVSSLLLAIRILSVGPGVLGPAEGGQPDPNAAADPVSDSPTTSARPTGRGLSLDPRPWIPNAWPTQQVCDLDPAHASWCVLARTDVFAGFRAGPIGGSQMSEFRLDRAEVGSGVLWRPWYRLYAGATVNVEAIRSAGPQSLTGIAGNSLVLRLVDAYAHAAVSLGPIAIGARAGLISERWIEQIEKGYDTRGIAPLASDRGAFFARSDVGASLTASGWKGRVDVDLELVNGEGGAQRELNRGKNSTVMVTVRPVLREFAGAPMVMALHGAFRDGSTGVASAADRRGAAAISFASAWVYAGFEYVRALGFNGHGDLKADTLGAWVSGRILPRWLGVFARYDRTHQDVTAKTAVAHLASGGLFSDVFQHIDRNRRRLRVYGAYEYQGYGAEASPLPGSPASSSSHRFILQIELRGLARLGTRT